MFILLIAIMAVIYLLSLGWQRRFADRQVLLEILPPLYGQAPSIQPLYAQLHALLNTHYKRWLHYRANLVITSEPDQGIRYLIGVDCSLVSGFKKQLYSYWPDLMVRTSQESVSVNRIKRIYNWHLKRHYMYPLVKSKTAGDPLSFILAGMTGLRDGESMRWQLSIMPRSGLRRNLINRLRAGESMPIATASLLARIGAVIVRTIAICFRITSDVLMEVFYGQDFARKRQLNRAVVRSKNGPMLQPTLILKLNAPLFATGIYCMIEAASRKRVKELNLVLSAALDSLGGYQRLLKSRVLISQMTPDRHTVLSYDELALLYHFPHTRQDYPEHLAVNSMTRLEAPIELKQGRHELVIGENDFRGHVTPIGLSASQRQKHILILGGTGMGKSSMMGYMIVQDMRAGRGLALIDPHGDLAKEMHRLVPKKRQHDLVYIDPTDLQEPIGMNLLELPTDLSGDALEMYKDFVTESVVSIFRKIFSEDASGGHRIEYILRNTIHTAFTVPNSTLFTLHKLLTNDMFRASVISNLKDDSLRDFWFGEFNKAGSYQRVKMIAGVTAKLGRFQRSSLTRKILEQPKSTIDFPELIESGKIVIGNFAKGVLGEDTSQLLSMILTTKLQLAALSRYSLAPKHRQLFYLYIDEFQTISTNGLIQFVGEARKFGLGVILSEQTTAHHDDYTANVLMANIGTVVCFKTASEIDSRRFGPLYEPLLKKHDLINLEPHNFYVHISGISRPEPVHGHTLLLSKRT